MENDTFKCECGKVSKFFSEGSITNAWQKNGYNYYEHTCECGHKEVKKIKIQD